MSAAAWLERAASVTRYISPLLPPVASNIVGFASVALEVAADVASAGYDPRHITRMADLDEKVSAARERRLARARLANAAGEDLYG